MLIGKNNKGRSGSGNWHDFYDEETCQRVCVDPHGTFIYVGVAPEPQYKWDREKGAYTDEIENQSYWVIQNENEHAFQNPILVTVSGPDEQSLQLGQEVVFVGMGGYYSRKKRSYSFRADAIKEVKPK